MYVSRRFHVGVAAIAIYRKSTARQVVNAVRGGGRVASQQSLPQLISLGSSSYTSRDPR